MAIEIRGMAPLLQVFDMTASIVFYRDVLGFQVKSTSSPGKERYTVDMEGQGLARSEEMRKSKV
jgi:hypothetical protein